MHFSQVAGALLSAAAIAGAHPAPHALDNLNLAQLSQMANDLPLLNNATLFELFQASTKILNGTTADSVLFNLTSTQVASNLTSGSSDYQVLAVSSPNDDNSSIQQDLMNRFRLYFVNVTEDSSAPAGPSGWYIDATESVESQFALQHRPTYWQIASNFFKNQANAVVGAFMTPFKVGAKAMMSSSIKHAQAVAAGTATGHKYSYPVLMTAIGLPNSAAQYAVNVSGSYQDRVNSYEVGLKNASNMAVDSTVENVQYGLEHAHQLTVEYVAKPTAAFVGTNLALAGSALSQIGSGMSHNAIQLSAVGTHLSTAGDSAVSAGSSAIVWALDPSVVLPGEQKASMKP